MDVQAFIKQAYRSFWIRFTHKPVFPTYSKKVEKLVSISGDPVRYAAIAMALSTIQKEDIYGDYVELGVWQGDLSRFIHQVSPTRILWLFDTFNGFNTTDLEIPSDKRFIDTTLDKVKKNIGDMNNIEIRQGHFPETARGLEDRRFSFVVLDFDLFQPTLDALNFFYPRMVDGAYLFIHDYNSPESNHAIRRAVDTYFNGHKNNIVELPDRWGSIIIRK